MSRELDGGLIYTDTKGCIGCNNCVRECPEFGANVTIVDEKGDSKIHLDETACILCGVCLEACNRKNRHFKDDCEKLFKDLSAIGGEKEMGEKGRKISLLIAPSFILNYPHEYKHILGYLKGKGINKFYSVSFGADITAWAYLNYIVKNNALGRISQPCPVIVNHIEKYQPELIPNLMPIQSPMMSMAIYLRKYLGVDDDLAFLGPCIAKKMEMKSARGKGLISYNVTYLSLMKHIKQNAVRLHSYLPVDDELEYGMGSLFPTPGGLRENIEFYMGSDALVLQVEGEQLVYEYLKKMRVRRLQTGKAPVLVDLLNCGKGCTYGTATEFNIANNDFVQMEIHKLRKQKQKTFKDENDTVILDPAERFAKLNQRFSHLDIRDFMCSYEGKPVSTREIRPNEIETMYLQLLKASEADRRIDCRSCGYNSCEDMAKAIITGINHKENCVYYVKAKLKGQISYQQSTINYFKELSGLIHLMNIDNIRISLDASIIDERVYDAVIHGEQMHQALNDLQQELQRIIESYDQISSVARTSNILSINAAIEATHLGEQGRGFSLIAEEMRSLAQNVLLIAQQSESNSTSLTKVLKKLVKSITAFTNRIDGIKGSTVEIKSNVGNITSRTNSMVELVEEHDRMEENTI